MGRIADNLKWVWDEIAAAAARAGRSADEVELVCVTKTVGVAEIREAVAAGVRIVGESRVQDGVRKRRELSDLGVRWDLIGHLQTNKAKAAVEAFDCVHSVDSLRLVEEVGRRAEQAGREVPILLEVNVSGEDSKFGYSSERLWTDLEPLGRIRGIRIEGLMTMAPLEADPEATRPVFAGLRELARRIREQDPPGVRMRHLSMGMSNDYVVAVEEGATLVRIGSAIFG